MISLQTRNNVKDAIRLVSPIAIKASEQDDGVFEGYGSVFGVLDSYKDVVLPGAFSASLEKHKTAGTLPAMLWQHNPGKPIGVYTEMREDQKGLFVRGRLSLDTEQGREAYALLKMGALRGLSIGFMPVDSERVDGVNRVKEVDLWEVSLVTFAANSAANVESVRSFDTKQINSLSDVEKCLRDEGGFSRSQATAIVARTTDLYRRQRDAVRGVSETKQGAEALLQKLKS